MKILVLVHALPSPGSGGVEAVAVEQAHEWRRRGHKVQFLARAAGGSEAPAEGRWRDIRVDGFDVREVGHDVGDPPSFRALLVNDAFDAALDDLFDSFAPDIVHVQHLVHLSLSLASRIRSRGVRLVVSLHDFFFSCDRLFLLDRDHQPCDGPDAGERCVACLADRCSADDALWRYEQGQQALRAADAIVVPSPSFGKKFAAGCGGPELPIEVIEPGLRFRPARRRRRREGEPLRMLFVGGFLPHKGIDLLIDALRQLDRDGWELEVRGHGTPGSAFEADVRARAAGLPVLWEGPFSAYEAPAIYRRTDLLILPSRCMESWSRVVREARAAGCGVVAARAGGPADFLRDDRDAILVPPGSASELADGIRILLDHPPIFRRISSARTVVPTVADGIDGLEALFDRLIAGR